ncbi:MAG: hypothetical protein WCE48_01425 [Steroidobacteraceae bacterium]
MLANLQPRGDGSPLLERQWREAVVAAWYAQRDYEEVVDQPETDDATFDRVWLRLWRAERARDELLQTMD